MPHTASSDPIARFRDSFHRASQSEAFDASRCVLATADASGRPSVRFLLVKEVDERGFRFHTHYESRKARELAVNPRAALAYHWASIGEQVRIEGVVERLPPELSDHYFASRPRGSQLSAWASPQSEPIETRAALEAMVAETARRFEGRTVPRPDYWGGYRLVPETIEFWIDGANRLHDRFLYRKTDSGWSMTRLAP
jgi:pyridoxamine 5'-phosphate oxidase